jgi:hypothetical protein
MLLLEAEISFSLEAIPNDICTKQIIRPAFNFGNNLLFSGNIIPDKKLDILVRGHIYRVIVELPTIELEAYENIKNLVCIGNSFTIQNPIKIVGHGKILDFTFEGA